LELKIFQVPPPLHHLSNLEGDSLIKRKGMKAKKVLHYSQNPFLKIIDHASMMLDWGMDKLSTYVYKSIVNLISA
jgi:hypothetical protein